VNDADENQARIGAIGKLDRDLAFPKFLHVGHGGSSQPFDINRSIGDASLVT
jgi:hypothetical protein